MKNLERPDYKFDLQSTPTKWKNYSSFPDHRIVLREHLPKDYSKEALQLCSGPFESGYVWAVANGRRYNKEIEQALSWLAMENILDKLLRL
jgi:hypothetical protein